MLVDAVILYADDVAVSLDRFHQADLMGKVPHGVFQAGTGLLRGKPLRAQGVQFAFAAGDLRNLDGGPGFSRKIDPFCLVDFAKGTLADLFGDLPFGPDLR